MTLYLVTHGVFDFFCHLYIFIYLGITALGSFFLGMERLPTFIATEAFNTHLLDINLTTDKLIHLFWWKCRNIQFQSDIRQHESHER